MVDKYTFRREFTDIYGATKTIEHTFEGESLTEILEDFLYFLNGCSYTYVKDLIYVKEDGFETSVMDYVYDEPKDAEDLNQMTLNLLDSTPKI